MTIKAVSKEKNLKLNTFRIFLDCSVTFEFSCLFLPLLHFFLNVYSLI